MQCPARQQADGKSEYAGMAELADALDLGAVTSVKSIYGECIMIIYRFDSKCWKCAKDVTYYTYLLFQEYDIDVTFPLDMSLVRRVYAEMPMHKDFPYFDLTSDALNFPVKVLGDDEFYDQQVIDSKKFPHIQNSYSKTAHKAYACNHCPHCNALLGNYHLREKITDEYLRPNLAMDICCEI